MIYLVFEDLDIKNVEKFYGSSGYKNLRVLATHSYLGNDSTTYYGLLLDQEPFAEIPNEITRMSRKIYQYSISKEDPEWEDVLKSLLISYGASIACNMQEVIHELIETMREIEDGSDVSLQEVFEMGEGELVSALHMGIADTGDTLEEANELLEDILGPISEEFAETLETYLSNTPYKNLDIEQIEDIAYDWALHTATLLHYYPDENEHISDICLNLEVQISTELHSELEETLEYIVANPRLYLKVVNYPGSFSS